MKKGDLVKLKQHCLDSGRYAIITESPEGLNCAKILFLDNGKKVSALLSNLILISKI